MTISSISRPPCRPKILPDEWVETYLLRLARANGIRRPWKADIERFRPTLPITAESKSNGHPSWGNITLPSWSVVGRAGRIRYCPACMVESKHIRARWRLASFEVCTIHNIRLKDDLVEPALTAGYGQGNRPFLSEVTDDQLWAGAVCPMPVERDYVSQIWSGFERSILAQDVERAVAILPYTILLERMLDALVAARRGRAQPSTDAQRALHRAAFAARYKFSTTGTLEGVCSFLDQIKEPLHRRAALGCLREVLCDEENRPTCLSAVPTAALRDRLAPIVSENGAAVAGKRPSIGSHRVRYVSLKSAVLLIGCRRALLQHLVNRQYLQDIKVVVRGLKRLTFLPQHEVEACRRWYHSIKKPAAAMQELHIDKRGYQVLLGADLLKSMKINAGIWHRRSDLADLCRRLEDVSQPYSATQTALYPLFGEWMFEKNTPGSMSQKILKEILQGKFRLFRQLEEPGVSAYYVDHTAVDRLQLLRRNYRSAQKYGEALSGQLPLVFE